MKKKFLTLTLSMVMAVGLVACTNAKQDSTKSESTKSVEEKADKKLTYLGKDYTISSKSNKLVITGSLESMEDALLLGVEPAGAISVGGKFPDIFKSITGNSKSIGEKTQPNVETILALKPNVILGTDKFPAETLEKLNKVAPTIPVSHIATDWEANLLLLGELSDKEDKAKELIEKYKSDVKASKEKLADKLKDKKVISVRIRQGNISIYPQNVFLNPVLYSDLGLAVPAEVKDAKAQEAISLEKFSELNPDYIFLQFSQDENKDKPKALDDLQNNPIWKSINAVKNGKVVINAVDPLAQGGTAWSKINFLKAVTEELAK
jgi:iron complex transport system substrate-binding protein